MRPLLQKIGVCTTAVPTMAGPNPGYNYFDSSQYKDKSIQLDNTGGWVSGTVAIQGSIDGGANWFPLTGPSGSLAAIAAPGIYQLPTCVVGWVRVVGSSLPASTTITVWFAGLDVRADM